MVSKISKAFFFSSSKIYICIFFHTQRCFLSFPVTNVQFLFFFLHPATTWRFTLFLMFIFNGSRGSGVTIAMVTAICGNLQRGRFLTRGCVSSLQSPHIPRILSGLLWESSLKAFYPSFHLVFGPLVWHANGVIIWVAFIWNCKTNLTKPTCPFCTARYPLYYAASCHIVLCKACSAWGYKVVMGSSERAHALAFLGSARFKCPFLELN